MGSDKTLKRVQPSPNLRQSYYLNSDLTELPHHSDSLIHSWKDAISPNRDFTEQYAMAMFSVQSYATSTNANQSNS